VLEKFLGKRSQMHIDGANRPHPLGLVLQLADFSSVTDLPRGSNGIEIAKLNNVNKVYFVDRYYGIIADRDGFPAGFEGLTLSVGMTQG
jgi:hypothetical protein